MDDFATHPGAHGFTHRVVPFHSKCECSLRDFSLVFSRGQCGPAGRTLSSSVGVVASTSA